MTIRLGVKTALAIGLIAIGDVDAGSIVESVTVRLISIERRGPCYIQLALVFAANGIGVVVDLHLLPC
jgi:hypothetical protein